MARKEKVEPGAEGFAVEVDEEIVVPREDDIVIPEKVKPRRCDYRRAGRPHAGCARGRGNGYRAYHSNGACGGHPLALWRRNGRAWTLLPSVIKANIPARIAFQSGGQGGFSGRFLTRWAQTSCSGKGDMLYLPPGSAKLIRAQGALITDQEIQGVVGLHRETGQAELRRGNSSAAFETLANSFSDESGIDEDEEIVQQCIEVIRSEQKASVSLLQRRLRLGYTRAARIMDELENRAGIVGPEQGCRAEGYSYRFGRRWCGRGGAERDLTPRNLNEGKYVLAFFVSVKTGFGEKTPAKF